MIRKLLKGAKGYEVPSIFTVVLVMLEMALEVVLPMLTANILNVLQLFATQVVEKSKLASDLLVYDFMGGTHSIVTVLAGTPLTGNSEVLLNTVFTYGILMVISSALSLTFGALAGHLCAVAGAGFSKNMRGSVLF